MSPPSTLAAATPDLAERIRAELRALVPLALPLAGLQLGQKLLGIVDTAVIGRLGEAPLAASGLGNGVYFGVSIFGIGIMRGLDPLVSQALGAGERRQAAELFRQGLILAPLVALPLMALTWLAAFALPWLGVGERVADLSASYVLGRLPGALPLMWLVAGRVFLEGHQRIRPIIIAVIAANLLNLPLSWLLVHGDEGLKTLGLGEMGFEGWGVFGAGIASAAATGVMALAVVLAGRILAAEDGVGLRFKPEPPVLSRAVRIGLPLGLTFVTEVGAFCGTSLFMAWIGERALAAHQVAITLASAAFMVPLGVSFAASVRVGRAIGREDGPGTRIAGMVAIAAGAALMGISALVFLFAPEALCHIVTDQPMVIAAATPLLLVAGLFQVFDGAQVVGIGALRGAGDTKWPFWLNLGGYYGIAIPFGLLLAFPLGLGAIGLWWGLLTGLAISAVSLTARFWMLTRQVVKRS